MGSAQEEPSVDTTLPLGILSAGHPKSMVMGGGHSSSGIPSTCSKNKQT